MSGSPYDLPAGLPVPVDDGAAAHLTGTPVADIELRCTDGLHHRLPVLCTAPTVLFFYPRTGVPGQPPNRGLHGEEWDEIPGARGCTPQSCAYRDAHPDFIALGVQVLGVSTQTVSFQREFKARNHVPFEFLSDGELALTTSMRLPSFEFPVESGGPNTLIKRMAWHVEDGVIQRVWYPVFPPQENAGQVLAWLRS